MFVEMFEGTQAECSEYVRDRGWDRPTKPVRPDWLIKQDGIVKTETGEQRFLVLTNWSQPS